MTQVLQNFCCIRSKDFSDGCIINGKRFAVDTFVLAIQLLVGKRVVWVIWLKSDNTLSFVIVLKEISSWIIKTISSKEFVEENLEKQLLLWCAKDLFKMKKWTNESSRIWAEFFNFERLFQMPFEAGMENFSERFKIVALYSSFHSSSYTCKNWEEILKVELQSTIETDGR